MGLIIDPKDIVIDGLGHLLIRIDLLQPINSELFNHLLRKALKPLQPRYVFIDLHNLKLSKRLQKQLRLSTEIGELVDRLAREDVHLEKSERILRICHVVLDGELQSHAVILRSRRKGLESQKLTHLPLRIVVHPAVDRRLLPRDVLQVLEKGARVSICPRPTKFFRLLFKDAIVPELAVERVVDLADLLGVLVLVLEVAGVDEDRLDVLLVLEIGLFDGPQAFVDHLIALVAFVELLRRNVQFLQGKLLRVLPLEQLRDLPVEDHLLADKVAHQLDLAQFLQFLDGEVELHQLLVALDDEVHDLEADGNAVVLLLVLLQEELRVYLVHHHVLHVLVVELEGLARLRPVPGRKLLFYKGDDVLLLAVPVKLNVLVGQHQLDLAAVVQLPVVGDELGHPQHAVLRRRPPDAELLDVLLVETERELPGDLLEEAVDQG
jgi:hypothetical protein